MKFAFVEIMPLEIHRNFIVTSVKYIQYIFKYGHYISIHVVVFFNIKYSVMITFLNSVNRCL